MPREIDSGRPHLTEAGRLHLAMIVQRIRIRLLVLIFTLGGLASAQPVEPLVVPVWPGVPPGSEGRETSESVRITDEGERVVSNVHRPSLTVFLPNGDNATGAGVLVIPGGGHRELWMDHEGYNIARWLAERGVAAFVLKYRLAREEGSSYTIADHATADARRAMKLIRRRSAEWGLDRHRIGVVGFSAGGEVAARLAMGYDRGNPEARDPVEREGSKPLFQGLIYPGASELIVPNSDSPPAFLCWGFQDRPDIAHDLADTYQAFQRVGVPVEMHVYSDAGHGFGLRERTTGPVAGWLKRLYDWMAGRGWLGGPVAASADGLAGVATGAP